jgi:hypothetical protein
MEVSDFTRWRKSSRSTNNQNCVELARHPGAAGVRDSKNISGPVLVFDETALVWFLANAKSGRFDS